MIVRILIGIVLICLALWSGYWFFGKDIHRKAIENIAVEFSKEGVSLNHTAIRVAGFPNRFDTRVAQPSLVDTRGRFSWYAEFLQILSLSYQPYKLIIVWPEQQTVSLGDHQINIESKGLRASLSIQQFDAINLDNVIGEAGLIKLSSSRGWSHQFSDVLLAMRHVNPSEESNGIEIAARAVRLFPSKPPTEATATPHWLAQLMTDFTDIKMSMVVEFDDAFSIEKCASGSIELRRIEVNDSTLRWQHGEITINAQLDVIDGEIQGYVHMDAGTRGFTSLLTNSGMPPELQLAAFLVDQFSESQISARLQDGKLTYQGSPLFSVPRLRLCS